MDPARMYLETAAVSAALMGEVAVDERWTQESALRGMTVAGLAGHLARSITLTEPLLDQDPCSVTPLSTAEYYLAGGDPTDFNSRANARIRETGEEAAADGPAALRSRLARSLRNLSQRLPAEDLSVPRLWFDRATTLETVLEARTLEMVVHIDDLAVSVGVITPELPRAALDSTIRVLVEIARGRASDLAVVRALTRRERVTIEALRVL